MDSSLAQKEGVIRNSRESTERDGDRRDRASGSEPIWRGLSVRSRSHDAAEGERDSRPCLWSFKGRVTSRRGVVPSSAEVVVGLNNDLLPLFFPTIVFGFARNIGRRTVAE